MADEPPAQLGAIRQGGERNGGRASTRNTSPPTRSWAEPLSASRKGRQSPTLRRPMHSKKCWSISNSIAHAAKGPSGIHLIDPIERFGISAQTKPKQADGSCVIGGRPGRKG